ncbi:MAG: hypothetical protein KDJ27_20555 [Gammaproteobacteria bacterium]|nr:hypothetical protein [Gammaproteobacteria bacterium]
MLTIKDLTASKELDHSAMNSIRGGYEMSESMLASYYGITNAPVIDAGAHVLAQGQVAQISQAGNIGGFNGVANYQGQNGVSGQVFGWW